jgi:class 3 adenylate cyclase
VDYEIRYAKNGKISIAWCDVGSGPIDLLLVPGLISHIDLQFRSPHYASWVARLASFCRVILMDKRGQGLSDRDVGEFTLEQRMDDLRTVLDAAGSQRTAVCGLSEGGPLSMMFAASYPERIRGLILAGSLISLAAVEEHPGQARANDVMRKIAKEGWGQGQLIDVLAPSMKADASARKFMAELERGAATPRAVIETLRWISQLDARPVAKSLKVPVLVWQRTGDALVMASHGRWLASNIPGAKYVEEPGDQHLPWFESDRFIAEVREFLTGSRDEIVVNRVLATVLFTDIVGSTEMLARRGDRAWAELLGQHRAIVADELARHRGQQVDDSGDGVFAVFDGPARAVQCATRIRNAVRPLGIEIRAGVHIGECERSGAKYAGIAVHTAARVMAQAAPGEVLVSRTVRDLVAGSGLSFRERGAHQLKGVPGTWELFAADN